MTRIATNDHPLPLNKDNNQLVDLTVTTATSLARQGQGAEVAERLSFLFLVLFIIPIEKSYGNNNLINKGVTNHAKYLTLCEAAKKPSKIGNGNLKQTNKTIVH